MTKRTASRRTEANKAMEFAAEDVDSMRIRYPHVTLGGTTHEA